jgi:hypothetical protein
MKKVIGSMVFIAVFAIAIVAKAQETQAPADGVRTATVKEMLIAGNYVYLLVVEEGEEVWLATTPHLVNDMNYGDVIEFLSEVEMVDFHSKGLDRTFASLWFVSRIQVKEDDATADAAEEKLL